MNIKKNVSHFIAVELGIMKLRMRKTFLIVSDTD